MYSALEVAKYVIDRCNELNRSISNLKLQKILYFIQIEFLVTLNTVCFKEAIEAWDFGPVVPVVYHEYKVYGSASIPCDQVGIPVSIIKAHKDIIDGVVEQCSQYSAATLVDITHRQAPWINNYKKGRGSIISTEELKEYFVPEG